MADFIINKEVETETPVVEVTVDPRDPLPFGRHRFSLVVFDDSGNPSRADEVEIVVADQEAPTALLKAPKVVNAGASFELDGSSSFDAGGGKIVRYVWTYLGPATL
jgi:hypothetical protein